MRSARFAPSPKSSCCEGVCVEKQGWCGVVWCGVVWCCVGGVVLFCVVWESCCEKVCADEQGWGGVVWCGVELWGDGARASLY